MVQIYSDKIFRNEIEKVVAFDKNSLINAFECLEQLRKKYWLVGYIRYEAFKKHNSIKPNTPLLYFRAYDRVEKYFPETRNIPKIVSYPKISKSEYFEKFEKIKEHIANGNTYEVNYTFPNEVWTETHGIELFEGLLNRQKTPYNAYIHNEFEEILSFSPELFFRIKNNKILTKPMKGTVKRGKDELEDRQNIEFLKSDEKNRAENVMIVDLLRNDLGQIAKTGTVKVDKLFEIETHKTLHQMTSEVSAEIESKTSLYEIFKAIFPCGSITGAPKVSTMRIINEIEPFSRDVYCGAIGVIHNDFAEFSVPIRILQRKNDEKCYTCHVGGAVVWDSDAEEEWAEALLKSQFLDTRKISLIETMRCENGKILFKDEHLSRLTNSAKLLNYDLSSELNISPNSENCIFRLKHTPYSEIIAEEINNNSLFSDKILFSNYIVNSNNSYLYHKIDFRPWYEETMQKIKNGECFDEIYSNERGEITEGARSNIIIEKSGKRYTPPVSVGLLAGIYRNHLLKQGFCEEKILYKNDILTADKIWCCNSVRGLVEVCL